MRAPNLRTKSSKTPVAHVTCNSWTSFQIKRVLKMHQVQKQKGCTRFRNKRLFTVEQKFSDSSYLVTVFCKERVIGEVICR